MAAKPKPWGPQARRWHRWLTWILLAQLTVWVLTAFGMTMVPRSAITAYRAAPAGAFDARSAFPALEALAAAAAGASAVTVAQGEGLVPIVSVRSDGEERPLTPALAPPPRLAPETIAARAAAIAGAPIAAEAVTLIERHSPEFQKHDLPAYRVAAPEAVLFFDPTTGALVEQTPPARLFENWMKTIHVMDYTGGAVFRRNVLLTAMAALFAVATVLGVISVRRIFFHRLKGSLALRLHQGLGLLLAVQAFLWVSSGLSVVWLLHPARESAEHHLAAPRAIAWERVRHHPAALLAPESEPPAKIVLTMLVDRPVYQVAWPGRAPRQALWDADTGAPLTLTVTDRDAIAAAALAPEPAGSLVRWEEAKSPADLDFYFYTGPYPVWKGFYERPSLGAIAIDQVTGHVHPPRIDTEIAIEQFYNVHVLNWRFGVIKYRQEPLLLAAIGLLGVLVVSGLIMQLRRLKATRPRPHSPPG